MEPSHCFVLGYSRYSIDKRSDAARAFRIDPNNGTVTVAKALDREVAAWHNLTVEATETGYSVAVMRRRAEVGGDSRSPMIRIIPNPESRIQMQ